jgi:hypothetical protein
MVLSIWPEVIEDDAPAPVAPAPVSSTGRSSTGRSYTGEPTPVVPTTGRSFLQQQCFDNNTCLFPSTFLPLCILLFPFFSLSMPHGFLYLPFEFFLLFFLFFFFQEQQLLY